MTRALIDHLWQSTLFAGAIWSITLLMRRNSAAVRHSLWLLASCKFLVPFSALYSIGAAAGLPTPVEFQPDFFGAAFSAATPVISPTQILVVAQAPGSSLLAPLLLCVWLAVAALLAARWLRGWWQAAAISRAARPAPGTLPDVRVTEAHIEPSVARVWHPVVLLPAALLRRLSPPQLDAVLAHEREHIARRDNLTAHLHRLVEALFWFHPLVWFIGRQLREERERACDESVLEHGHDPAIYAAGILEVCRHCADAHSRHAVAALSGDLTQRIGAILACRPPQSLGFIKAFLLSACTLAVASIPLVAGAMDDAARRREILAFHVDALRDASIEVGVSRADAGVATQVIARGNEVLVRNSSLRELVAMAYGVAPYQVAGAGIWLDDLRYDVRAIVPQDVSEPDEFDPTALRGVVNRLLGSRFDLEIHVNQQCQHPCGRAAAPLGAPARH